MPLTRLQLVTLALDQAQLDSSFVTKANLWLNYILEKLGRRTNFKFYNKNAPDVAFVTGVKDYALPTDFGRADACFLIGPSQEIGAEIPLYEPYVFDPTKNDTSSGNATTAMIDLEAMLIRFNIKPDATAGSNYSYRLRYFTTPPQYSLTSSDDNVVPNFQDQEWLLQELIAMAFEFSDDERQQSKKADAKMAQKDFLRNSYESDGVSSVDLDRLVFRSRASRNSWRNGGSW